jgi:hypothetical protein
VEQGKWVLETKMIKIMAVEMTPAGVAKTFNTVITRKQPIAAEQTKNELLTFISRKGKSFKNPSRL